MKQGSQSMVRVLGLSTVLICCAHVALANEKAKTLLVPSQGNVACFNCGGKPKTDFLSTTALNQSDFGVDKSGLTFSYWSKSYDVSMYSQIYFSMFADANLLQRKKFFCVCCC